MSEKKYSADEILIRAARREDMVDVADMKQELAENKVERPKLSVRDLQRDGFDKSSPAFSCIVAEYTEGCTDPPKVVGYAIYFPTYSTWEGCSMMLEDLYVRKCMRRQGIGERLFDAVAKEAYSMGCSRIEFHVLKGNDARQFYEKKGAVDLTAAEQWCCYRLSGDALKAIAEQN